MEHCYILPGTVLAFLIDRHGNRVAWKIDSTCICNSSVEMQLPHNNIGIDYSSLADSLTEFSKITGIMKIKFEGIKLTVCSHL